MYTSGIALVLATQAFAEVARAKAVHQAKRLGGWSRVNGFERWMQRFVATGEYTHTFKPVYRYRWPE